MRGEKMKKKFSVISTIFFIFGWGVFLIVMLGSVILGRDNFLFVGIVICIVISLFGLVISVFSENGIYKRIGIAGNSIMSFVTIFIALVINIFFWDTL